MFSRNLLTRSQRQETEQDGKKMTQSIFLCIVDALPWSLGVSKLWPSESLKASGSFQ